MINELCAQIWSRSGFSEDLSWASMSGAKIYFQKAETEMIKKNIKAILRLIQSALIFSLSENSQYRQTAYEIAVLSRNMIAQLVKECPEKYRKMEAAISLIFSRLGNFPAEKKYLLETSLSLNDTLPRTLWFEREGHFIDNTVNIEGFNSITLTDFQLELWNAVSKFPVVIVNAPTSAGKSYILQNHVIDLLKRNTINNALYIVPTRALIEQVVGDFKSLLKLSQTSNDIIVTEVPSTDVISRRNVFVLTQERTQVLMEQDVSIDLVIIDEAQNVADSARGIILQSVIEKIKEKNVHAKFIFATPFVKNPDVFLTVFKFNTNSYKVIPVGESPVSQNLYNIVIVNNDLSNMQIFKQQKDGAFAHICDMQSQYELSDDRKYLAIIPLAVGKGQNNIIFGSDPSNCEYIAGLLSQAIAMSEQAIDDDLKEFSEFIEEHIHKDYLLAETVKHGVAYHYGNLPSFIRKGIERLCVAGKIKYIVCTSTLLQGVNLPAQNIFIMKPSKGYKADKTPIPLSTPDFWNLAGRAGRLTKDFEGNIFLINVLDWVSNPLVERERRQVISPSFKRYVCNPDEGLSEYILDINHKSGDPATQGIENTFMKLFILNAEGSLYEALERLEDDLSKEQMETIISCIKYAATDITLPYEIYSKNPNISIYRQQELYNYLKIRISQKGPLYLIPPHPMHKFEDIKFDYIRLFQKFNKYFSKDVSNLYVYFSNLALLWMRGITYSDLLRSRIEYENKRRKRGQANVNTEARELFEDIEFALRFKYVKFSKCYNDLLSYLLREIQEEKYLASIPPLHLFLELGGSSSTMISLIGMGLSRTSAAQIVPHMISTSMNRDEIARWFRQNNINALDLPKSVLSEMKQVLL